MITASRLSLTWALTMEGGTTSSLRCFRAMLTGVSPSKGTRPVASSNIRMPREYRSLRASMKPPRACSGEA